MAFVVAVSASCLIIGICLGAAAGYLLGREVGRNEGQ